MYQKADYARQNSAPVKMFTSKSPEPVNILLHDKKKLMFQMKLRLLVS